MRRKASNFMTNGDALRHFSGLGNCKDRTILLFSRSSVKMNNLISYLMEYDDVFTRLRPPRPRGFQLLAASNPPDNDDDSGGTDNCSSAARQCVNCTRNFWGKNKQNI